MGRRTSVGDTVTIPVDGENTRSPHANEITASIRVQFPPETDHHDVAHAVLLAASQVLAKLEADGGWLMLAPLRPGP